MPWYRVVGNWGLNVLTWMFVGMWTTDSQSGLRGFNRRAIESIDVRMDRMEVSSEFIKQIRRHQLKFAETPIRAIYTDYSLEKGQSNWNGFRILLRLFADGLLGD
jgi:UDP-N-acetylglucosamine---dolichyl-phosphate N-acetylglucosaminyltransferase